MEGIRYSKYPTVQKERPPVKQNKKCWLKPQAFSHLCVQSDMLENGQNLRDHSSAIAWINPKILSILYHGSTHIVKSEYECVEGISVSRPFFIVVAA